MRKKKQPASRPLSWPDAAARVVEELEDESQAGQLRVDGVQHAIRLESQADRLLAMVLLGMIAGGVALLFTANFDLWIGASVFLALACFAVGLSLTVLHVRDLRRLATHADALAMDDESATKQFDELQGEINIAFSLQLVMSTLGASLAAGGMIAHFWQYAWRAGVIALCLTALLLVIVAVMYFRAKFRG